MPADSDHTHVHKPTQSAHATCHWQWRLPVLREFDLLSHGQLGPFRGLFEQNETRLFVLSSWRLRKHFALTEVRAQTWYKVCFYELVNPTFKLSLCVPAPSDFARCLHTCDPMSHGLYFSNHPCLRFLRMHTYHLHIKKLKSVKMFTPRQW